ncbi:hypothetical protein ACZ90_61795 [Streptomyces albus subsp. albus]|nr:hypothetical protein ACZ90_61795 [Streptomyces albus subsp. albus]
MDISPTQPRKASAPSPSQCTLSAWACISWLMQRMSYHASISAVALASSTSGSALAIMSQSSWWDLSSN